MKVVQSQRLGALPPYLFARLDELKQEALSRGVDIIDLGIGDPDLPTPAPIIERLYTAAQDPANHRYPSYVGMLAFREAVANWFKQRYHVQLDPKSEIVSLIGSKEGIAHIPLAFVNPGDVVLVPDPGYPVYQSSTIFAGGIPCIMPLLPENNFLPDLDAIDKNMLAKAKLMFINYPNNPTAAIASREYLQSVIDFAYKHNIILCQDAAYNEMGYDDYKPLSILELDGGRDVAIEFHSFSKTFNMTGWRLGFAVGNKDIVQGLGKIKTNVDSGVFQAVQWAGIEALKHYNEFVPTFCKTFASRSAIIIAGLQKLGFQINYSKATFYLWIRVPKGFDSTGFCLHLLDQAGIIVTPGVGFGQYGEGFFRIATTVPQERLYEALERIRKVVL
ncbi:MAG: LL-diaminopimelate aminotransferase [Candidatus Schekmanbacteria bacterium]|nr:LL-diaminopimelate aminotransferase [Candidatus Schekmanbacteria bacterium]